MLQVEHSLTGAIQTAFRWHSEQPDPAEGEAPKSADKAAIWGKKYNSGEERARMSEYVD